MGCGMLVVYSILFLGLVHQTRSQNIFILAGQSNMAGRGGVVNNTWDGVIPHQSEATPSILSLDAHLHWVQAHEPLHRDIDYTKTCGVGPGMPFAHALLARHPALAPLALVPCAIGGTSIAEWARGTPLYRHMINRARAAAAQGGHVQGIVWFQGERDTLSQADAAEYGHRLLRLLSDWRADLQDPLLPIVLVAIASGEGPFINKVREAQMEISLLNVIVVDAMGLPLEPDHLHLTTEAQVQLGEKLGRSFLKFLPSPIQRNVAQNASPPTLCLHSSHVVWTCIVTVTLAAFF